MSTDHKPGCEALGGYGHGVGPCTCGADTTKADLPVVAWESTMRYGAGRVLTHDKPEGSTHVPGVGLSEVTNETALTDHAAAQARITALQAELELVLRKNKTARAEAFEEAAVIAENTWEAEVGGDEESSGFAQYGENSAAAIRAMASSDAGRGA